MAMIKHETMEEAMNTYGENFAKAVGTVKWLAAVWCVNGGKLELVGRTTWDFPPESFDECIELLRRDLGRESPTPPPPSGPLPFADFLSKKVGEVAAAAAEEKKSDESLVTGTSDVEPPLGHVIDMVKNEIPDVPNPEGIPGE